MKDYILGLVFAIVALMLLGVGQGVWAILPAAASVGLLGSTLLNLIK